MAWIEYNPNPTQSKRTGDCAVRAVAKAIDSDWETAYLNLCLNGFSMGDLPNANIVIASVLRQHGYKRMDIPTRCPDCMTVAEFCNEFPNGKYVVRTDEHIVAIENGDYYDSFDSGDEIVVFAWGK